MLRKILLTVIVVSFFSLYLIVGDKAISAYTSSNVGQEITQNQNAHLIGQVAKNGLLEMVSTGDYVGNGKSYHLNEGTFTAQLGINRRGKVDSIKVRYYAIGSIAEEWTVDITSAMIGKALAKRKYSKVGRYLFESQGSAGLSVFGEHRGCNELTGSFEIEVLDIDYTSSVPTLKRLTVSFNQLCEGREPALKGTLFFNTTTNETLPFKAKPYSQ